MRFWDYLRYRRRMLLAAAVCCVIFAASFALYRLPLRAVLYPVGLCLLVGLGFAVWDYRRTLKRHRALTGYGDLTAELLRELPPPESLAEEDYRAQLLHLRQLCTELQSAADNRYRDAIEYYTTWAHQIKTPIASMRLALQGEDTALFRRLLSDLSRTEQYVEMVMAFLRLEDAPGDYVFREVALDEVLRQALRNVSFSVEQGEYVAVMGESGSGKTTLLNILAALDKPTAGSVVLDGRELSKVGDADAAAFRRDNLGFVFQEFNLLDTFSLEDNIALPLVLAGKGYREINERLMPVARRLGIAELLKKYPYEVSGGQKQRAAVARAIITRPSLLLADEPTGALDSRSSDELLRLFGELNRGGQTIVMVTHSVRAASTAGRVLFIKDGEVFHQLYRGGRTEEQFYQEISGTLTLLATGGMEQ